VILHRYSTALGEVQAAIVQIRRWLDQGIAPSSIAVVAPQIEDYWPSLREYCAIEGIPTNKNSIAVLSTHVEIQRLQAQLKLRNGSTEAAVLESVRYSDFSGSSEMPYWDFQKRYTHNYGEGRGLPADAVSSEDFLRIVTQEFKGSAMAWLQIVVQKFLEDVPEDLALPFSSWLDYFERLCSRTEIEIESADPDGIHILNLASVDWIPAEYFWCMGLTEENLKRFEPAGLSASEVMTLSSQLGFNLPMPDQRQKEFDALWFLQRPAKESHLSTATTDFAGAVQASSLIWLKAAFEVGIPHDLLQVPEPTRLRELQRSAKMQPVVCEFKAADTVSLSPTTIESYLQCPFTVAAKKVFHLRDEPALDLDMDPMARGLFQHALFEILSVEPIQCDRTDDEILAVIDSLQAKASLGEAAFWPVVRRRYLKIAKEFLAFEQEWRKEFPLTRTLYRELPVNAVWSLDQQKFLMEGRGLRFRGRMDRLDGDGGDQVVLIDYKGSKGDLHHWNKWMEHDELQLAAYVLAIEDGVTAIGQQHIAGAFYYVLKSRDRSRGFRRRESTLTLFSETDGSRNWISESEYQELLSEARAVFQKVAVGVSEGRFAPEPKDLKICNQCHWKVLCRAPHLQ
jgi:RecB family exonuclease